MFEIDGDDTLNESLQEVGAGGSYWDIFESGYETALESLVRPPRVKYRRSQLGPEEFEFGGRTFCRETVELRNAKMQNLESYHWRPLMVEAGKEVPCIVFLPSHLGSLMEALQVLRVCLASGFSVCTMDFAGIGMSDGDEVTWGYQEQADLGCLLDHLSASDHANRSKVKQWEQERDSNGDDEGKKGPTTALPRFSCISKFLLWGRTLGAATAILHSQKVCSDWRSSARKGPPIVGLILDTPWSNMDLLVEEMLQRGAKRGITVPKMLVAGGMRLIMQGLQKRLGSDFHYKTLAPADNMSSVNLPCLVGAARDDTHVLPLHADIILRKLEENKADVSYMLFVGSERPPRPAAWLTRCAEFARKVCYGDVNGEGKEDDGKTTAASDAAASTAAVPAAAGSGIIQKGECGHEESLPWSIPFDPSARHVERCYTEKTNVEKDVVVSALSEKRMKLNMAAKGTCIDWRFETAKNDISFGWEFVPYDAAGYAEHKHELDIDRFSSHLFPIRGSFECPVPGELTLVWDNKYSYFTGKTLSFEIVVKTLVGRRSFDGSDFEEGEGKR